MNNSKASKTIRLTGVQKPFLERNEVLSLYYHDIQSYNPLSHEEMLKLFHTYHNGTQKEKIIARDTIFNHNTKLVVSMARKYSSASDNLLDIIEEGNIGLLNAIDRFDPSKDSSFQKFALYHIRREINLFKINGTPVVKRTNRSKTDNTVSAIVSEFTQREERNPTEHEIVMEYNKQNADNKINNTSDVINVEYVYIDSLAPTQGEINDAQNYLDYSDKTASYNNVLDIFSSEYNKEIITLLMKGLTPKEQQAVKLFYGLDGELETSLGVIGLKMNCSSERARQLCKSAIEKMKKKSENLSYAK